MSRWQVTDKELTGWKRLREMGLSIEALARHTGRHPTTVAYHLRSEIGEKRREQWRRSRAKIREAVKQQKDVIDG